MIKTQAFCIRVSRFHWIQHSLSSYLISNPYLCLPPLSSQASWRTWWSRCLQSGPASPTHGSPIPWWATWGWTRPAGGPCCGNRAPWRRGPARPAPTQKTAPPLPEEAAPKKYLREAENPDTPREPPPLHLDPWPLTPGPAAPPDP